MPAHPLDRASPLPLWAQLHDDLRRRLADGELSERFPGELELVAEYAVSRNTVREALRRLREDGSVVVARGRRPRVAHPIRPRLGALYSLSETVRAAGLPERSVVRVQELGRDAAAAARLGVGAETPLVHLERLRLAGGEPLAYEEVWLPGDLAAPLLEADLSRSGLYRELAERAGLRPTGGEEQLSAIVPGRRLRALLELPAGVAAFSIERLSRVGERPLEWRRTVVRGDRFSVLAEFSALGPGPGGGADLLAGAGTSPRTTP